MGQPTFGSRSTRRLYGILGRREAAAGAGAQVAIALAAGAANVMGVTVTVQDEDGATVAGVHVLDLWASDAATGAALTASAFSGDLVAATGAVLSSPTAKKNWKIQTAANGIFTGNLTDTAKPQAIYVAAANPQSGRAHVSVISAGKFG